MRDTSYIDRNLNIENILKSWEAEVKPDHPTLYSYEDGLLIIATNVPGSFIGYHGTLIDKYRKMLKDSIPSFEDIKFIYKTIR